MRIFNNNKNVTMKDLEKSGKYDFKLLKDLNGRHFESLADISIENRADIDYIEPLLYAVRKEWKTYIVYKYYSRRLQNNEELGAKIILTEPELIENTPLANNKDFIINNVSDNPQIIKYMSPQLKNEGDFITTLVSSKNKEVLEEVVTNCEVSEVLVEHPELINNNHFMKELINQDVKYLSMLNPNLRDDYNFLKDASQDNSQIIDYVVENVNEFGLNGIKGVRDISKKNTIDDCINIIDEMSESSDDKRYAKVKEKIRERGKDNLYVVGWVTAMVAQDDNVNLGIVKKIFNYAILTMEKIKQDVSVEGQMQVSLENVLELINPPILQKLIKNIEKQGIVIDDYLKAGLDMYTKFYRKYHQLFDQQKKKKISISEVEKATSKVSFSKVEEATQQVKIQVKQKNIIEKENDDIVEKE